MSKTNLFSAVGLAGLVGLALPAVGRAQTYVSTNFSTDPTAAGWQEASGSGGDTSWSSSGGYSGGSLACGTSGSSGGWYSPVFDPTPGAYYEIQYDAKLTTPGDKACCWVLYGNPNATYNLETTPINGGQLYKTTSTGSQVLSGQLLADNATSIQASTGTSLGNGWEQITMFTRVPTNATQSFVYFGPGNALSSTNSCGVSISNVQITAASISQVQAFSDSVSGNTANYPVSMNNSAYTPANRFANLPNTYATLSSKQNLNVVLLGDSIIGDTSNSYFDALVQRNFPGATVTIQDAEGHGTGMGAWLYPSSSSWSQAPLNIQQAVYNQPKGSLVIIGGISNGLYDSASTLQTNLGISTSNEASTISIINALKSQGKEVLLTTGDFGSYNGTPISSSNFVPTVNGSTTGSDPTLAYRNWMYNLAQSEGVGFFDTYGAWGSYMLQLEAKGMSPDTYYRDFYTHGNTIGKDIVGQMYGSFFTSVPEPGPLDLFGLGTLAILSVRWRRPR